VLREARKGQIVRDKLHLVLRSLEADLRKLSDCVNAFGQTKAKFELAKAAVISTGSATLLEALDAVKLGLSSDLLHGLLRNKQWHDVHQTLNLMDAELDMIRTTAAFATTTNQPVEASPDGLQIPETLDEAYEVLNVNRHARREVVERLVNALRQTWHPDLGSDEADRKIRTAKIQQIHAAWEIIIGKRL
jgi:hypothetical protein